MMTKAERSRRWYYKDRAKAKRMVVESNRRARVAAIALLGGKCMRCGFDDERALHLDHIHGGGQVERAKIRSHGVVRNVLHGKPGYQLLCANCNFIKAREEGELIEWSKYYGR